MTTTQNPTDDNAAEASLADQDRLDAEKTVAELIAEDMAW